MTNDTVTRVIEWIAPGYEGAYTQYVVNSEGWLYVTQIATRDNLARALQNNRQFSQRLDSHTAALAVMNQHIIDRTEDGAAVELDANGNRINAHN